MLKLHRLELSGFKSFVDRSALDVAGGLTAIVGPNGCGKSNIADAVVWVLGERSAKSLRGEKMEDVIFAGAKTRKPVGMAEVTLELTTDNGFEAAVDVRLSIGRRVFRDGESQYLLNGKIVRLKDIKDLLMDTGLGIRAYSMIEQGKIGMILSGKPQERRRLLEEAAGITRYRERRRLSEIKLEEARVNLARLDDIVSEVERSLRSLKRQANAARRYKDRQEEYKVLLRQVLEARWSHLQLQLRTITEQLDKMVGRESELTAKLHHDEATLAEAREELDALGRRLAERHSRAAELAATIEGKQEFLKGSRQRLQEIAERVGAGRLALEQRQERLAELANSLGELEARRDTLLGERDQAASHVSADEQKITQVESLVAETEDQVESLRGRLLSSINDLSSSRNLLHREQLEKEKGDLRRRHLAEELEQKKQDIEEAAGSLNTSGRQLEVLEEQVDAKRQQMAELTATLDAHLENERQLSLEKTEIETDLGSLRQRSELLAELGIRHQERRQALQEALARAGLEETRFLADHLRVPEGWAPSLDLFLGALEDAVILPAEEDALGLARALAGGRGSGSLLRPRHNADPLPLVDHPAVRSTLGDALGLTPEVAAALPPAYLVDSPADAERLAQDHPGISFISRERIWAQSGVLHVQGVSAAPGLLAREQELVVVKEQIPPKETEIASVLADLDNTEHEITVCRGHTRQFEQELGELTQELAVAQARHDDVQIRHRRLTVEQQTLETEKADVERELTLVVERIERTTDEVGRNERRHAELEAAFDQAQTDVNATRQERESTRTSGASRKGRLELLQERLDSHDQEVERLRREIEEGRRQSSLWGEEEHHFTARQAEIRSAMKQAEEALQQALEQREASQEEVIAEQEQLDAKRVEILTLEERVDSTRETRDGVRSEIGDIRVTEASEKQEAEHLMASFQEEFGEQPPTEPIDSEVVLEEVEVDLARCKETLERLGPVNLLAAAEWEEHDERHQFLTEQHADVANSVDRLKETIRELNETSTERFLATFNEVNAYFRKTFVELFRGGQAEMCLLDESDPLETVIEIVARPPGKRLQNIMLMSGGEKALTAIALLFALFQTKPSPFCILDEVDAPLDDINTLRFVELVKKMSTETQFVLITHNKLTMEAASKLYGVTMQERGVSNLVAVELDEVEPVPATT
jgi:chromosome segregation protein